MLTLTPDNMKKDAFYKNRNNMPSSLRSFQLGFNKLSAKVPSRFIWSRVRAVNAIMKRRALKINKSAVRGLTGTLFYASGFMFR